MSDLEHSVLVSLDGRDPRLFPFLPDLLQDLDDLGADPALIEALLSRHAHLPVAARILDLGCGKGSVSLRLLQHHPWQALGLDGMPAFVDRARERAEQLGLATRCRFEAVDIRTWASEARFDVIVLGAIGPVLGDTTATLRHVATWLAPEGVVLVDEAYLPDDAPSRNEAYNQSRAELLAAIRAAGFSILAEGRSEEAGREEEFRSMFAAIRRRAEALAERHPELRPLFEAYVAAQALEFEILADEIIDVTLLLGRHELPRTMERGSLRSLTSDPVDTL